MKLCIYLLLIGLNGINYGQSNLRTKTAIMRTTRMAEMTIEKEFFLLNLQMCMCSRKMIIMMMYMRNRYTFSSTRGYEYMQRARFINSMYTLTFAAATAVTIVAFIWFVIWPPARWETITKWPLCHSHSNRHLPQTIRFCHLHLEQHATCKHKNMHRQK